MTTHITPEEARRYYKSQVDGHVEQIVQSLSLQPPESAVHNVEAYHDGMRVPVTLSGNLTVYVYCLPWQRGWSIFATTLTDHVASFSWRTVTLRWRAYQMPVYNPRDVLGPWNCPVEQVAAAFEYTVRRVQNIDKHRAAQIKRFRNGGWSY